MGRCIRVLAGAEQRKRRLKILKPEKRLRQAGMQLDPLGHLQRNYPIPRVVGGEGERRTPVTWTLL
jgi:hypothetical protein